MDGVYINNHVVLPLCNPLVFAVTCVDISTPLSLTLVSKDKITTNLVTDLIDLFTIHELGQPPFYQTE